jgi:Methionine synthase I, cobalamin-binding domain
VENKSLMQQLKDDILICDGGMGSLLQDKGLLPGEFPERWNITNPEVIIEIGKLYLDAGADIINTNTFGANSLKFEKEGEFSLENIIKASVKIAKEAIKRSKRGVGYIALDIGPTGKLLRPMGDLSFDDAYEIFYEVIEIGVKEGADLVLIETMSDSYEAKAALLAAKEFNVPVFVTMIFDEKGKLLTGGNIMSTVALLEGLGADAIGINCGLGPYQMKELVGDIIKWASVPVIVNPNAGLPRSENGKTIYDIDALEFAQVVKSIVDMGARIVGGCCGTTPEHIEALKEQIKDIIPKPIEKKNFTIVTSYSQAVLISEDPVIVGERINPTGKVKFKQALRDHNLNYILNEGISQQEKGAHILDVNVGLPEINEAKLMEEVIFELQSILDTPLQIDTSDFIAMEKAMRIYNGKPMINSVNGKAEIMDKVFPLVKKYGGVVVALALDEKGIPDTADERIEIAKKIYKRAEEYGINKKDIIIDALAMTISTDAQSAKVTLDTLRRVRDELGGYTTLGVSNISFGLPARENITSVFYTMALYNGLSVGIINPNSEEMMKAFYSYRSLLGYDLQCENYIDRYAASKNTLPVSIKENGNNSNASRNKDGINVIAGQEITLGVTIEKGLKDQSGPVVKSLLETREPLDIINSEMIPALDNVGKRFEKGTLYLPQLLMSAEAAKSAFEVIKNYLIESGIKEEKKAKIILATVKGDIHDIGKNIVKVLLENYSYEVIDLGKDVSPELIVKTVVEKNVKLVGLSALMTTTVPSMAETIVQLREKAPNVKIMVGGAVMTKEYADTIDADMYCKDAMASVNYAETVFR